MQRNLWMRPALQKSEAVLLPALPRRQQAEPRFSDRYTRPAPAEDPFRPFPDIAAAPASTLALSTYVRPRGSMAGRSVLRAAGVSAEPFRRRAKPRYYSARSRTVPVPAWHRA